MVTRPFWPQNHSFVIAPIFAHAMNETPRKSRLVSGDGPINRRTVNRDLLRESPSHETVNPEAIARAERSQARNAMGAGLEDQVQSIQTQVRQAPHALQIMSSIVLACAVVIGLLAWLQKSLFLGGAACGLLITGMLGLIWWKRQSKQGSRGGMGLSTSIFDKKALQSFDAALEAAAYELSPEVSSTLRQIKASLGTIAIRNSRSDEHFTQDDRMYLVECLRRYIPDSLEAYLRVPREQRKQAILPEGASAEEAMLKQLHLIQDEIEMRDKKISRSAAEDLLKQQRFLESKKTQ